MRKLTACLLSLAATPALAQTMPEDNHQPNCQQFAVQQVAELKQQYPGSLSSREIDIALQTAQRSCLALHQDLQGERSALQSERKELQTERASQQATQQDNEKLHWWEQREEEGRAIPGIRKAQKTGGK